MPERLDISGDRPTYQAVGWTLLGGLLLSVAVMVIGLIAAAVSGAHNTAHVLPLDQVLPSLAGGQANALLDLGILLLFATPLANVLVALYGFIRQRDTPFVLITLGLVVMLAIGFAVALIQ